jgi:hypothetical protein
MILQNLEKYETQMVNKFIEEAVIDMMKNHGYGETILVLGAKGVCDIIPSPMYNYGDGKINNRKKDYYDTKNFAEAMKQIKQSIIDIRERSKHGIIKIRFNNHKIVSVVPTFLSEKYMFKLC